jgi:hypothetical protein
MTLCPCGGGGRDFSWVDVWVLNPEWLSLTGWRLLPADAESLWLKVSVMGADVGRALSFNIPWHSPYNCEKSRKSSVRVAGKGLRIVHSVDLSPCYGQLQLITDIQSLSAKAAGDCGQLSVRKVWRSWLHGIFFRHNVLSLHPLTSHCSLLSDILATSNCVVMLLISELYVDLLSVGMSSNWRARRSFG